MNMKPQLSVLRTVVFTACVLAASTPFLLWTHTLKCLTAKNIIGKLYGALLFDDGVHSSCVFEFMFLIAVVAGGLHLTMQKTTYRWLHRYDGFRYMGRKYRFEIGCVLFTLAVSYLIFG